MKSFALILSFVFFGISSVFSQEQYSQHIVSKGETVYKIAKKYGVNPQDLMTINPESKGVLKLNTVLLIPKSTNTFLKEEIVAKTIEHEILAKETLYGISKQYQTTVEDIKKENPILKTKGLEVGQKIKIPKQEIVAEKDSLNQNTLVVNKQKNEQESVENQVVLDSKEEKTFVREILPKETKYGIAKEYGISVIALEDQNPEIKDKFPVGYKLHITTNKKEAVSEWSTPLAKDLSLEEPVSVTEKDTCSVEDNTNSDLLDRLVLVASDNIGTRYRMGGMGENGFDCSGLMVTTFESCDIQLPRTSIEQSKFGTKIDLSEAQKGDLIFFRIKKKRINHVGMVVEVNDGEVKFIHASLSRGVMISSIKEPYYQRYFAQVNHVL